MNLHKPAFLLMIIFLLFSCSKKEKEEKTPFALGEINTIYSEILGEDREVVVYVPEGYHKNDVNQKYPVLYVLDGNWYFVPVTGIVRTLSFAYNMPIPKMIVVGIIHKNRNSELTPPNISSNGEGDKFLAFVEKELIPYINQTYPTTSFKTLFGHSRGGVFALNTMLDRTDLFNNYLVTDPNIDSYGKSFLEKTDSILKNKKFNDVSIYLAISNTLETETLEEALFANGQEEHHMRIAWNYCKSFENDSLNGINFDWKYYPETGHHDVNIPAIYDGLRFLFNYHKFSTFPHVFEFSKGKITKSQFLGDIEKHFDTISNKLHYKVLPLEKMINVYGEILNEDGYPDLAKIMFEMNIKNHPFSAKVYLSMGDFNLSQKDTAQVVENYKKSLEIKESDYLRNKLNILLLSK